MRVQRLTLNIEFQVNLDPVPGACHTPDWWVKHLEDTLAQNEHYSPAAKIQVAGVREVDTKVNPATGRFTHFEEVSGTGRRTSDEPETAFIMERPENGSKIWVLVTAFIMERPELSKLTTEELDSLSGALTDFAGDILD